MSEPFWHTGITRVEPNYIEVRGYSLAEMMGSRSFGDMVYLLMSGELPRRREGEMVEAILVAGADHSIAAPSTAAARLVASGGAPLQAAVAAGLIALDTHHGGAMEDCARLLQEALGTAPPPGGCVSALPGNMSDSDCLDLARCLVARVRAAGGRVPGFGHPVHTADPRTQRLRQLARAWGLYSAHLRLADAVETVLSERRPLPLNVDGAIAGIMSDMGLDWRVGRGFYVIARAAGLVAHVREQQARERPFKAPAWSEVVYTGPGPRPLPAQPDAPAHSAEQ